MREHLFDLVSIGLARLQQAALMPV